MGVTFLCKKLPCVVSVLETLSSIATTCMHTYYRYLLYPRRNLCNTVNPFPSCLYPASRINMFLLFRYRKRFNIDVEPLIEQLVDKSKVEESMFKAGESQKQVGSSIIWSLLLSVKFLETSIEFRRKIKIYAFLFFRNTKFRLLYIFLTKAVEQIGLEYV